MTLGPSLAIRPIEDSATYQDVLHKELTGEGYSVAQAFSGPEGLELLEELRPDCVLLDLVMP